jgi:4-carboxymuconolactone decarboxylase
MNDEERLKQGFALRRSVLGEAHVDGAEAAKTELNADFQNFITRYAWGEVWARPGLDRRARSLITVAMLIALNRPDELRMHLLAAFNNGVTEEELREVVFHSSLYCGLPAANSAFHLAAEVLESRRSAKPSEDPPLESPTPR